VKIAKNKGCIVSETNPTIALLTDFGTEDGYVGAMKGRILSELPHCQLVDISHQIAPYNIRQAAFCLNNAYPYFPEQSIFVVVVDPGVGTERPGIVVKTSRYYFVGPDNGVFSFVYHREGYQVYHIDLSAFSEPVSSTFHGRDVFARVAAWLAAGKPLEKYLIPTKKVICLFQQPRRNNDNVIETEVLHIDHFGNIILNINNIFWEEIGAPKRFTLKAGSQQFTKIHKTFGDVAPGELLLVWDSSGYLQIAKNQGSAAAEMHIQPGDKISVQL
jgi:hypothetical protein